LDISLGKEQPKSKMHSCTTLDTIPAIFFSTNKAGKSFYALPTTLYFCNPKYNNLNPTFHHPR
jgi:hypothetical protein